MKICIVASSIAIASTDRETRARDDRSIASRGNHHGNVDTRARPVRARRTNERDERTNERMTD